MDNWERRRLESLLVLYVANVAIIALFQWFW